ncbi:MAG: UDP-N-acetylmuramate--L-alanine ligase [Treponema sp.]|jgi:UDP-N-acetylmuramate--alanine ligase|nr:UDP-N-acetylmuramate--L-alanine ligase [Treponema sp.]
MDYKQFLQPGCKVYMIGIKGTGMCALSELLFHAGVSVSGSDTSETFYTDEILTTMGIPYYEGFAVNHLDGKNLGDKPDLVIYSAAYSSDNNCEMAYASGAAIPMLKYTDALGVFSSCYDSSGIAGVHGKTTTTALAGTLIQALHLPAQILVGSGVSAFGGTSTLSLGQKYFVAETCEYRRHFLSFHPNRIILTSVEWDHQDFFPSYESIRDTFVDYIKLLPNGGELIYCHDDVGAKEVVALIKKERPDIQYIPYGFTAKGDYHIECMKTIEERTQMKLEGFDQIFKLKVSGKHLVLDAAAAIALTISLAKKEFAVSQLDDITLSKMSEALETFSGSRRRSEILGETNDILFMDDYGHHPTAIKTTLEGLKEFYPKRRIIVSFMSHTYTRTAALLEEFSSSFSSADVLLLHKIYGSAREQYHGGVNGKTLFEHAKKYNKDIHYIEEPLDAKDFLMKELKPGDLFVTMGAGDNWKLGKVVFALLQAQGPKILSAEVLETQSLGENY